RTADLDIPTPDRVLDLREVEPDVLISLHLNSSSNPDVSGVSTYYKHMGSKKLSEHILDGMLKLGLNEFGLIGNFNFLLNSPIEYSNTLVEIAFLSNPDDEKRVLEPKFHKQTAIQIFKELKAWLKEERKYKIIQDRSIFMNFIMNYMVVSILFFLFLSVCCVSESSSSK